jgi:hypothetical protein
LQIDDWRRDLSSYGWNCDRCCRRNHYMRSRAESTPGMGDIRRSMNVHYLNGRAENQQQSAENRKGNLPATSHLRVGRLTKHL